MHENREKYLKFIKHKKELARKDREEKLKVAEEISRFLKKKHNCRVFLFGSLLKEDGTQYNDIDLMVEGLEVDLGDFFDIQAEVEERFEKHEIDLQKAEIMSGNFIKYMERREL